uniref:Uncharacterized protein n=1 Tax=Chromera velia CCMP2878 TaxID=1169474 RepID=A0A0G4HNI9_9ALVE|eukprot:Cvel_7700.t1-p1 / transcript=Cvel_7700.t1 / gene=Cvel_7700 / organism=Chromera_velia_CCMP2878 / gene_product=hypothetical protein / transcript_product=hypothetical protein / location=Cvel_scaffold409:11676-11978(-) / protein_length=101 / sequence_SO=supercontig / SO=protein_coding / is_pseudo=false
MWRRRSLFLPDRHGMEVLSAVWRDTVSTLFSALLTLPPKTPAQVDKEDLVGTLSGAALVMGMAGTVVNDNTGRASIRVASGAGLDLSEGGSGHMKGWVYFD